MSTVLSEIQKIKRTKVSAKELEKAKAHIKGTLALELETSGAVAVDAATSLVNLGRVRGLDEIMKGVDRVTASAVQRVARDLLQSSKLNLAIIGPHLDNAKFASLLRV